MKKNDLIKTIKRTIIVGLAGACTSIVLAGAACNTYGTTLKCVTFTKCNAGSQNCSPASRYPGTVSDQGTKTTVTGVTYFMWWTSGYKNPTRNLGPCTWVCTITSDCKGQSPQETGYGGNNIAPGTNSCEYR